MRFTDADGPGQKRSLIHGGEFLRELHRKTNGLCLRRIRWFVTVEMASAVTPRNADAVERIDLTRLFLAIAWLSPFAREDLHSGAKTFLADLYFGRIRSLTTFIRNDGKFCLFLIPGHIVEGDYSTCDATEPNITRTRRVIKSYVNHDTFLMSVFRNLLLRIGLADPSAERSAISVFLLDDDERRHKWFEKRFKGDGLDVA